MANDFRSFNVSLDAFTRKVGLAPGLVAKRVAFDIFGRIVRKTPVDTGRARASWTISLNQPDRSVVQSVRTRVGAGVSTGLAKRALTMAVTKLALQPLTTKSMDVKMGDSIWISNNLPYIVKLEEGHSQQAPAGMVAVSLAEVNMSMSKLVSAGLKDAGL